ncbi:MAG: hypothetical protein ACLR8Y_19595 [Alistipes indistinctus]
MTPVKDTTVKDSAAKGNKTPGKYDRLVVVDVRTGDSTVVDSVKNFTVAENGRSVLYTREADSLKAVYVYTVDPKRGVLQRELWSSKLGAVSPSLVLDRSGEQGAFLVTADTVKHALYDLYYFSTTDLKPRQVADAQIIGLPGEICREPVREPFVQSRRNRLQFGIAPKTERGTQGYVACR